MLRLAVLFFLTLSSLCCLGNDIVTVSPKHTFEIVQKYKDSWSEAFHFFKDRENDVELEQGTSWPGLFYIAPDDRWVLRIQKTGSGDNIAYLYKIETNQRVWRLEQEIRELGLALLSHRRNGLPAYPYHIGIEFSSWDMETESLHFTLHASPGNGGQRMECPFTFHLHDQSIASP